MLTEVRILKTRGRHTFGGRKRDARLLSEWKRFGREVVWASRCGSGGWESVSWAVLTGWAGTMGWNAESKQAAVATSLPTTRYYQYIMTFVKSNFGPHKTWKLIVTRNKYSIRLYYQPPSWCWGRWQGQGPCSPPWPAASGSASAASPPPPHFPQRLLFSPAAGAWWQFVEIKIAKKISQF